VQGIEKDFQMQRSSLLQRIADHNFLSLTCIRRDAVNKDKCQDFLSQSN